MKFFNILLLVFFQIFHNALSKESTPPMGWNSWNHFACNITEDLIKDTIDSVISLKLSTVGYKYVNMDDCWQASSRDENGNLFADTTRFPNGVKALSDYAHSKDLKFGIYSSAGFKTCQGYPASLGLELTDIKTFHTWGIDFLKYDNCYNDKATPYQRYYPMSNAIQALDTNIFYSLCEWGRANIAAWGYKIADSWRVSPDIKDSWLSVITRIMIDAPLWRYAGPTTGWNDPDMLEVGNGHLSPNQEMYHFTMWSILKAPLIIGNDLREVSPSDSSYKVLSNAEVIAINQDSLGRQARRTWSNTMNDYQTILGSSASVERVIATKCAQKNSKTEDRMFEDNPLDQEWIYQPDDGTIMSSSTGLCLTEHVDVSTATLNYTSLSTVDNPYDILSGLVQNHVVFVSDCDSATKWDIGQRAGGSIVSRTSKRCLEVSTNDLIPIAQGKRIQTGICQDIPVPSPKEYFDMDISEHQSWVNPSSNFLNLYQRQCLTIDRDAPIGSEEVWSSPLANGGSVVALTNKGEIDKIMTLTWAMVDKNIMYMNRDPHNHANKSIQAYKLRDVWAGRDLLQILRPDNELSFLVPGRGGVVLLTLDAIVM